MPLPYRWLTSLMMRYNGKSILPSEVKASLLNCDGGSIKIIGSTLTVIEAYSTVTVYSADVDDEVIYDRYDAYNKVLRLKNCEYRIYDKDLKPIGIEKININDIIDLEVKS